MARPIIGIIGNAHLVNDEYPVQAVGVSNIEAVADLTGAIPLVVPALPKVGAIADLIEACAGFVFTGGRPNIHPSHYGVEPTEAHGAFDPDRDAVTLPLIRECVARGVPVFGICRGFQEFNVAFGGTLHPEIREIPGRMNHRMPPDGTLQEKFELRHVVRLAAGGAFRRILGAEEVLVNSLHGQGILERGRRVVVEGLAPDDTPEAIVIEDAPGFAIAVQWHPEWNAANDPVSRPLFQALGAAVRPRAGISPGEKVVDSVADAEDITAEARAGRAVQVRAMPSLNLMGGMEFVHAGARQPLPQSRKTRALLAMLAMADRPLRRDKLCEIFWQVPDDPKGALRWSLSKIRALLGAGGAGRVQADRSEVRLDAEGLEIDARTLLAAAAAPLEALPEARLEALARLCRGGFLDDLDLPDAFEFRAWRIAERESLRAVEVRLRRRLVEFGAGGERAVPQAFRLVEIAPEDEAHHRALIAALEAAGQVREAEEQRRLSLAQLRDLGVAPSAALRAGRGRAPAPAPPEASAPAARRASSVPSVLVGGFRNLGTDRADAYLAEGLVEETTRALARMPWFLSVKPPDAGADGAADYVLSGTLMRGAGRLRVNYRLIDRAAGSQVLANRIEAGAEDALAAQDDIAGQIAAAMEPAICLAELEALRRRDPAEPSAYEHYLRGWSLAFGATGMDAPRAMAQFEDALALDPEHAPAAIMLAWLGMQQTANVNADGMRVCSELARTALRYASDDGAIIAQSALVLMFCERDWDTAAKLAGTARRLGPWSPQVWSATGWVELCCGEPSAALASFDRSLALTLTHPFGYIAQSGRANALLQTGDAEAAVAAARAAVNDNPTFHPSWRVLAAALAIAGDRERAAAAAGRLRALAPHETVAFVRGWLPYRMPDQLDRLCRALEAAGLPAG